MEEKETITQESSTSYQEFVLKNGEIVNISLSFKRLALLRKLNFELYERFNKINYGKSEDILDLVTMIYVAYWCENHKIGKEIYSEDDFIELVPFDMTEIQRVYNSLMRPKKK